MKPSSWNQYVRPIGTIVVTALVLNAIVFLIIYGWNKNSQRSDSVALNIHDLPQNVMYIDHPEDIPIAAEKGGIVMRHYATPEAEAKGGPIYGLLGYRVVSIEYTVPSEKIMSRPIGNGTDAGFSLSKLSLPRDLKYDHFHIGSGHSHITAERHDHSRIASSTRQVSTFENREQSADENTESVTIHFMLIPHDLEVAYGLTCS